MSVYKHFLVVTFVIILAQTVAGCALLAGTPSGGQDDADHLPELPGITVIVQDDSAGAAAREKTVGPPVAYSLPPGTDVVIRQGKERTIHEYRLHGQLYSIKVVPKVGSPYYLVAVDTGGHFVRSDRPKILIPSWKVLTW